MQGPVKSEYGFGRLQSSDMRMVRGKKSRSQFRLRQRSVCGDSNEIMMGSR